MLCCYLPLLDIPVQSVNLPLKLVPLHLQRLLGYCLKTFLRMGCGWGRGERGERRAPIVAKDAKTAGRRNVASGRNGCVVFCQNPWNETSLSEGEDSKDDSEEEE